MGWRVFSRVEPRIVSPHLINVLQPQRRVVEQVGKLLVNLERILVGE
jgi:hypothetical protein